MLRQNLYTFFLSLILLVSCDILTPQVNFKLAIPVNDFTYNRSAQHLKLFLEKEGYQIDILPCENAIEANKMVGNGEADLTFIMNHSDFIPEVIGSKAGNLRTVLPLFERLFFLFSRNAILDTTKSTREILANKTVGIEVLGGETHANLKKLLQSCQIQNVEIVTKDQNPDFIHFWGTYYGPRATDLLNDNWQEISIDPTWEDFIILNDPALKPFTLPAIPGIEESLTLNTFSIQTLLVGRFDLGENAIYKLSEYIFKHKLELMGQDLMYRSINENFDASKILYPIHNGTDSYFQRNEPTFFERYSQVLAAVFSICAVIFGAVQAIRTVIAKRKKERIDQYFLNFLEIKSNREANAEKGEQFDELLQRALVQMTNEKLDKGDFHILARLIQQELSNLK
ncbi:hypothetical protein [Flexithrix dorotheae]|uniref:hypothetical protein n=1 Tax=Flexithrix dorotheae TaxID=70993 RepID=UPI0003665B00|nr:hypothetical protein [Flexithrix dorotheae]